MMQYGRVWTDADEWEYQDFDSLYRNADEYNRYGEPPDEEIMETEHNAKDVMQRTCKSCGVPLTNPWDRLCGMCEESPK